MSCNRGTADDGRDLCHDVFSESEMPETGFGDLKETFWVRMPDETQLAMVLPHQLKMA